MTLETFLIFATFAVIIATAVLVPTCLQIIKSAKKAEQALDIVSQELEPLSKNLAASAKEIELLAASFNAKMEATDSVIRTTRQASETLLLTSQAFRDSVKPIISSVGAVSAGLQMFGKVVLRGKSK